MKLLKSIGGQRVVILIQRTSKTLIIEELSERVAMLIQHTSGSLIIEEFRGQRVDILIQRTSGSLIIEKCRGSTGSDFNTAHEQELAYWMV